MSELLLDAADAVHGRRLRALVVVLWRAGLRIKARVELPIGLLFCVVNGPTRGRPWSASAARSDLRHDHSRSQRTMFG